MNMVLYMYNNLKLEKGKKYDFVVRGDLLSFIREALVIVY